jgi:signal transduction histidine kinase
VSWHERHHRRHEERERRRRRWLEHLERHGHGPWWAGGPVGGRLRFFLAAHLHRRLFMWFGVSIFLAIVTANLVRHAVGPGPGHRLFAMFAAACVLWLIAGRIARRLAHPFVELLRVTEEIGAGRLSARAQLPHWQMGEAAYLAAAINDMAARIEKQVGDQRELLAGVSHEIRTPLARMRVLLELGRSRGGDAKTFDDLEREVVEVDALVGQLLASARLDFADLTVATLDGAEVARRALERAGVDDAGVLALDGAPLTFDGDPTLLARALANLLENARRHAGGVTKVRVRSRAAGVVAFEVEDAGPGFPAAGEKRERAEGSLGLGLVLVRRIADAHRGSVTIANRAEGGARVTLEVTSPAARG